MAQQTALSVMATPGRVHSFTAKTPAAVLAPAGKFEIFGEFFAAVDSGGAASMGPILGQQAGILAVDPVE